ncbi:3f09d185-4078-4032-b7a1-e3e2866d4b16 [Thermothielavioides terrestris]|uniref:3f09d185-4078-4032-b7a1-e3e2866d4b16 n=1 Tax=Thermothielavioides terrestris TaxID=2587410 RepID=A0A446BR54_9PEZI|nr:3f09d185-4078-4032-b7a1-e3e2866d4b16 [Thermothielavioides terrestris]
MYFNFEESE